MTDERRFALTQDYLSDRLSDFERAAFEKRLAMDPELVQELEVCLRLREGLARLRDEGELRSLTRPPRRMAYRSVFAGLAAVLVATLLVYAVYPRRLPVVMAESLSSLTTPTSEPLTVAASYSFATMRSAIDVPKIPLPSTGALELRVLTSLSGTGTCEVVLDTHELHHASSRVGVVRHVAPDADGFVAIYVNALLLKPGSYSIFVESEETDPSTREQFEFELQQQDRPTSVIH